VGRRIVDCRLALFRFRLRGKPRWPAVPFIPAQRRPRDALRGLLGFFIIPILAFGMVAIVWFAP